MIRSINSADGTQLPGGGGPSLAVPGRRERGGVHLLGHPPLLFYLHPGPGVGGGDALHLPVRDGRNRPAHHPAQVGSGEDGIAAAAAAVWEARTDRYSEIRSAATVDFPKVEMSYIGG